ncbi:SidA/IucD/PvdA family monooxygenase [Faucicola osloensis]
MDVIGIGIGPFNLSLATLLQNKDCGLTSAFLRKRKAFLA